MEENDSSRVCFLRKRLRGGKHPHPLSLCFANPAPPKEGALFVLSERGIKARPSGELACQRRRGSVRFFCILHNRTIKLLVLMCPQTHKLHTGRTVMTLG